MPWPWKSNRGTIVRHPADFYPERCAWAYAHYSNNVPPQGQGFVELFNNSAPAVNFRIYSIVSNTTFSGDPYLVIRPGPLGTTSIPAGTNVNSVIQPVIAGGAAAPGQMLWGFIATQDAALPALLPLVTPLSGSGFSQFVVSAPIAVLKPGYSAIVYNYFGTTDSEAAFYYMWD